MYKGDVVVGDYDITEGGEAFFYSLFTTAMSVLHLGTKRGGCTCILTSSGRLFLRCCSS